MMKDWLDLWVPGVLLLLIIVAAIFLSRAK